MGKVLAAAVPEYGTVQVFLIGGGDVSVWSRKMTWLLTTFARRDEWTSLRRV
jgi:hypothetical protein